MFAILTISLKNLRRNKLRTAMTIIGAGVGLSLFIVLMTIAQSLKLQVHHMIDSFGIDIAIQAGGAPNPISSRIAFSEIDRVRGMAGVKSASGLVVGSQRLSWSNYFVLLGAHATDPFLDRFPLVAGRLYKNDAREITIGSLLARKRRLKIGDTFQLGRHGGFTVTGIFNTGSRAFDGAACMGMPMAQAVLQRGEDVNLIAVRLAQGQASSKILPLIQDRFPHLEVMRGFDFVSQLRLFRTVNGFAEAVAAISLIACCITVMDTLLMAVSERTKEIGILMAIGWSRWRIVTTLLSESILVCLLGSVVGSLLGTLFLWFTSDSQMLGIGWVPVWPSLKIVAQALIISIAMGCLSALYPGIVASRLQPATALRFEK